METRTLHSSLITIHLVWAVKSTETLHSSLNMKLTALVENTCHNPVLQAEHGLSLLIETQGLTILFDMGQTDLFARNAEALGIDLSKVDFAIISHGHYDHGGGFHAFRRLNPGAPVYIRPQAFEPYYNRSGKYIGLDTSISRDPGLVLCHSNISPAHNISLCSCPAPDIGVSGLWRRDEDSMVPDDFQHEQYMQIQEDGRRILFSGCSHRGILNIVSHLRPEVLVGGFHLSHTQPGQELGNLASQLNNFPTEYYTCHCTGLAQYEHMLPRMERLHYLSTGETITI